jgi:hypothetical protein
MGLVVTFMPQSPAARDPSILRAGQSRGLLADAGLGIFARVGIVAAVRCF